MREREGSDFVLHLLEASVATIDGETDDVSGLRDRAKLFQPSTFARLGESEDGADRALRIAHCDAVAARLHENAEVLPFIRM